MQDLGCQRAAFDIPGAITYLNAAYMGPLSRDVVAAGRDGLERKMHPWTITAPDFFEPVERIRERFAELIGADADGVAVLPATSYGVAIAAANLGLAAGERIVLLAEQFPSNVYAWHELARERGGTVVTVPRPGDDRWTDAVEGAIDERTAIVAVPNCHWTDGTRIDLERVGARARAVDAAFVVDGTQSVGAMPFDTAAVRPDYLIVSVYKWLLGPYSAALMWCAPRRRDGGPLEHSWITRAGAADFTGLVDYTQGLRNGARRYDVGETSNFALVPAIDAALAQTLEWGVDRVAAYVQRLTDRIADRARALGLGVASADVRAPHLIGVRLSGVDPEAVTATMAAANVHVSVRGDAVRVSPHVYNDEADVDRFLDALEAALRKDA